MILWSIKLLGSVRRAIAGRKYPHQMAWAVAFGLLLGVVPHGNLLAILLLLVVLSLKINHAMAGLTAVAATFVATRLDPFSHQVGDYVLTHPRLSETAANAWQLPLMPWTDLNNTVVMGSFLIGVGALVPVFVITYPVFRFLAPGDKGSDDRADKGALPTDARQSDDLNHRVVLVDSAHDEVSPPHRPAPSAPQHGQLASGDAHHEVDFVEFEGDQDESENRVAVETRIDVIRMKDHRGTDSASTDDDASDQKQPMDEALNYLLRQLRDSQQRKAA